MRGAGVLLALQVAGLGVGFAVQLLLARALGVDMYGVYVLTLSWLAFLVLPCRPGLATGAVRFVAAYRGAGDWGHLRGFLRFSLGVVLLCSLVVVTVSVLAILGLGERLSRPLANALLVGCVGLPLWALLQVAGSTLRGLGRVVIAQAPTTVVQPAVFALLVIAGLGTGWARPDATQAMAAWVVSVLMTLALSALALRGAVPDEVGGVEPLTRGGDWARVAAPLFMMNVLYVAIQHSDVVVLGSLLGPKEAGLYAPARRIATLIALGLGAVNTWAAPLIADLHNRGERERLQLLVRRAAQLIFGFTAPLTLGVLIWGRPILGLFGPEFAAAYAALVILVAGQVANALMGPVAFLMTMTGQQGAAARILGVSAALNLGLLALLIPRWGIEGAAAASAAANVVWNVAMAWAVWRRLGLRATVI